MGFLTVNGNLVNFDGTHPKNAVFGFAANAANSNYILVQTKWALNRGEMQEMTDAGAQFQEYLDENLYLFRYEPADLRPIRNKGFVIRAGIYQKGLKITADLQQSTNVDPSCSREVYLVLHQDRDEGQEPSAILPDISRLAGVSQDQIEVDGNKVKLTVASSAALDSLAGVDAIKTIEEVPQKVLFNNIASRILGADAVLYNNTAYKGTGQVVCVADTGLDKGDVNDVHPAFKGRVKALIPVSRPDKTDDPNGHGTHVCGSVLGNRVDPTNDENKPQGIAPEATLVMQSCVTSDGEGLKTGALSKLLLEPYRQHGARIHTNSWGQRWTGVQARYSDESKEIDKCVHENPDLLVIFAAGNDGAESAGATVGSHASAKNSLTVGATESARPSDTAYYVPTKKSNNDPTEISWYSSRGPTREGRIKPDIVAPGTAILSAKSSIAKITGYGPPPNDQYVYMTGTSMATPLVAGCAAVLREVLIKNGVEKPSAALMKALLINGAFALHHAHSAKEGFGRVNLSNSILIPGKDYDNASVITGKSLADRDEFHEYTLTIPTKPPASTNENGGDAVHDVTVHPPAPGNGSTLKVTLVYTDAPGAALQNDLNLIVTTSDGAKRHGNMGSCTKDLRTTEPKYDTANNVEQIVWKGIHPGQVKITVRAARIVTFGRPQEYVLVWRVIPNEH